MNSACKNQILARSGILYLSSFHLPTNVPAGKVKIKLIAGDSELTLLIWDFEAMKSNVNQAGPTARGKLPTSKTDRFKVVLEVE